MCEKRLTHHLLALAARMSVARVTIQPGSGTSARGWHEAATRPPIRDGSGAAVYLGLVLLGYSPSGFGDEVQGRDSESLSDRR